MEINQVFLHGFMTEEKVTAPLVITGDENELTLTKGEGFDAWMADTTRIIDPDGAELTFNTMNKEMLRRIVMAWLDGEEFNQ